MCHKGRATLLFKSDDNLTVMSCKLKLNKLKLITEVIDIILFVSLLMLISCYVETVILFYITGDSRPWTKEPAATNFAALPRHRSTPFSGSIFLPIKAEGSKPSHLLQQVQGGAVYVTLL